MARSKKEANITEETAISAETPVADEPKVEIVAESSPETGKTDVKSADEGVAELKKRLEASEQDKERLTRERNEAVQRAYHAKNEKEDTDLRLIEGAKSQIAEQNKALKRDYALALAQQNFELAADIQEAMALNQAKALQLENGAQSLKERPKDAPRPLDPVEALATQLSPKSAAWVRAHPEFATNQRLTQKMIAAHNLAVADGLAPDTDAYFEAVEDTLKVAQRAPTRAVQDDDGEERLSEASRPTSGRQVAPSAIPVSRETSTSGQRTRIVRLTPQEAEHAELSGMSEQEYYNQKMAIAEERRSGRLN